MRLPSMIVTDLDGTLLPASKVLPARSREVLQALAAQGVTIALASGKFIHLAGEYARQLGPGTALIAINGARVQVAGRAISARTIPLAAALDLLESAGRDGDFVFAEDGADSMLLSHPAETLPESILVWASQIRRVDDVREHLDGDPGVMVFGDRREEAVQGLITRCAAAFPQVATYRFNDPFDDTPGVMLHAKGTSKGSGVADLCAHFGYHPETCMVFGDWYNDLPMFSAGGVNVAVANARDELKARAHHVTELDCEHEGVADFLERAFL